MNVGRQALLTGGILGAMGWSFYGLFGRESRPYKSDVRVRNNHSSPVDIELTLSNIDVHKTILDQSFTLEPEKDFRRQGVFANNTQYRV